MPIFLILLVLLILLIILYHRKILLIILSEFSIPNREEINKKQQSRLKNLLVKDINEYKIMTKKDITSKESKKSYITAHTSGTSGNIVAISHNYETFVETQMITGMKIFNSYITNYIDNFKILDGRVKMVFLISVHQTLTHLLAKNVPWFLSFISQIIVISFEDSLLDIINKLNKIQPDIIVSYPTFLELLIENKADNKPGNEDLKIKPSLIITGSEKLTPIIRNKLENTFIHSEIIETYSCTECPPMAVSCSHKNLHLMEDICYVELIDQHNNLLPMDVGIVSHKVLITNLINTYQPIIRYMLDDSIEILPNCPCKSPYKTIKVHGRSDDIFNLIDDNGKFKKVLPASIESSIFLNVPLISYQVIHTHQNFLLILFISKNNCYDLLKKQVDKYLLSRELSNVNYKLKKVNKIKRQKGGKIRQIISLI